MDVQLIFKIFRHHRARVGLDPVTCSGAISSPEVF
jgi:hypothetical protein